MSHHRGLETLAVAGHGGSVVLHVLASVWHTVTAKKFDHWAALHAGVAVLSAASIAVHIRRISHESSQET